MSVSYRFLGTKNLGMDSRGDMARKALHPSPPETQRQAHEDCFLDVSRTTHFFFPT